MILLLLLSTFASFLSPVENAQLLKLSCLLTIGILLLDLCDVELATFFFFNLRKQEEQVEESERRRVDGQML